MIELHRGGARSEDEQFGHLARTSLMIEPHRGGLRSEDEQSRRQTRTTLIFGATHRGAAL